MLMFKVNCLLYTCLSRSYIFCRLHSLYFLVLCTDTWNFQKRSSSFLCKLSKTLRPVWSTIMLNSIRKQFINSRIVSLMFDLLSLLKLMFMLYSNYFWMCNSYLIWSMFMSRLPDFCWDSVFWREGFSWRASGRQGWDVCFREGFHWNHCWSSKIRM